MTRKYRRIFAATLAASGLGGTSAMAHNAAEEAAIGEAHAAVHDSQAQAAANVSPFGALAAGAAVRATVSGPPSAVGQWAPPVPLPKNVIGIHAVMLPTGKVLWFGTKINPSSLHNPPGPGSDPSAAVASGPYGASAVVWDPAGGTNGFTRIDPAENIWCAGQSLLSDGSVLVTGGTYAYSDATFDFRGSKQVATFDPFTETWNMSHPNMRHGRWYPTQVELDDGRTLISSGNDESGMPSFTRKLDFDVFTPGATRASAGSLRNYPDARGGDGEPPNGAWYPHHFLMPSGRVLTAGPWVEDTWRLNTPKTDATAGPMWRNLSRRPNWGTGAVRTGLRQRREPRRSWCRRRVDPAGGAAGHEQRCDEAGRPWVPQAPAQAVRPPEHRCSCPTARWSRSAAASARQQQPVADRRRPSTRSSSGTPRPASGPSAPRRSRAAPITRPRCCCPTGACSRPATTGHQRRRGTDRTTPRSTARPTCSRARARRSPTRRPASRYGGPDERRHARHQRHQAALIAPSATTHANDMNQRYVPSRSRSAPAA